MQEWREANQESRARWEQNAAHWDARMGATSNQFHNELVKPATDALLQVKKGERVLEIACGNGNYARHLCDLGAEVVAFDFSANLVAAARSRSEGYNIEYHVLDATDSNALLQLGEGTFSAAVSNMALMDMAEILPLIRALHRLLVPGGRFVFSIMHPCFQPPGLVKVTETVDTGDAVTTRHMIKLSGYKSLTCYEGRALADQPVPQLYFHRPLEWIMTAFFDAGFVLDGLREPVFAKSEGTKWDWVDIPPVIVLRFRKV